MDGEQWWWCTVHEQVEDSSTTCRAADRYGPYESPEAARDWRSRFEQREEEWEEQDREWAGDAAHDEDDDGGGHEADDA